MAAIDKIYVESYEEYLKFKEWCLGQPKIKDKYGVEGKISDYLYNYNSPFKGSHPVFNAPYYVDAYVIRNCPLEFIQKELMLNYGHHSQEWINEAYKVVMERNGNKGKPGEYFHWLSNDDFKIVNGIITMPNEKPSSYELIKEGKLYNSPKEDYEFGKHFKCTKHPKYFYNRALKCRNWFVDVDVPIEMGFAWYHKEHNSWDLSGEFVISKWSSSTCIKYRTIKAVKRAIRKWKLPIGAIVRVTGRYVEDTYEFVVKK